MTPERRHRSDEGFTLVEVLVTLTILSFAIVVLVGTMASLTLSTEHHRGLGSTDSAIRNWAEAVKSKAIAVSAFTPCPAWTDLNPMVVVPAFWPTAFAFPAGTDATGTPSIEYWAPASASDPRTMTLLGTDDAGRSACTDRYNTICRGDTQPACDNVVERVNLGVTSTDVKTRGGQTTTQIVLRRGNGT